MMGRTIGDLFTHYGSDKDTEHSYGPVYAELFGAIWVEIGAFLEVGIAQGASLRAWREYFPNAAIVGLDHHADPGPIPGVEQVRANSTVAAEVNAVLGDRTFDAIVDDGGHWLEEQQPTFENLWPRVRPGGVYVVEDLQSQEALDWFRAVPGATVHDRRGIKGRGDDVIVVIRKPGLSVFQLDDYEWWVGESAQACLDAARQEYGDETYDEMMEDSTPHELNEAALGKLQFRDEDGSSRSFAEQLQHEIAEGGKFPRIFASTEC